MLSGHSTVVVAKDQASCNVADEAVILHLRTGTYYGLNSVGARVWNLIQEPRTVHQVRDAILEEYQVDAEICERDLLVLLRDLAAKELVRVEDETGWRKA